MYTICQFVTLKPPAGTRMKVILYNKYEIMAAVADNSFLTVLYNVLLQALIMNAIFQWNEVNDRWYTKTLAN